MHSNCLFKHFRPFPKPRIYLLAALWGVGLVVGILLSAFSSHESHLILRSALSDSPEPFLLFLTSALPVVVTAIASATPFSALSYPLVFLFAVCYGFCGILIYLTQGSSSWLLRSMVLFSTSCTSVLMWWLLIQNSEGRRAKFSADIRLAAIIFCFIFIIDLFVISPLLSDLAKYF